MRYKENNSQRTPLGEKFDNMDFPFEPVAWSQMESLLADSKKQTKGGFSSTKRIISLLILGVIISLGSAVVLKKDKANLVNQSPFSTNKNKELSPTLMFESTVTPSVFSTKKIENEEHNEAISFLENKDKKQVNATSKSWHYDYKTINYNPNLRRLNTQFTLLNNDDKTIFKNTNTYYNNLFNLEKEKDNFEKNSKNGDLKNEKLVVNALLIDSTTKVLPPNQKGWQAQYLEEKTTQNSTNQALVLDEIYIPINRGIISETELLPVYESTEEVISEYGLDFAPYGWAMDDMKTINQPLWRGLKHQISFGYGLVGGVDGLNLRYTRRITPLLGLGIAYNIYKEFDGVGFTNLELEGQFYVVHKKRFELALTIGYGFQWINRSPISSHELKDGANFSVGIEPRFLFTDRWSAGLRFDAHANGANILGTIGYRF
jgi:uncharacterized protein YcfL